MGSELMTTALVSRYTTTELGFFEMSNLSNTTALSGTAPFGVPSIPVGTVAPVVPAAPEPKAKPSKAKVPSDKEAKSLAIQAFNENATGGKLIGTAEQRISYAVAIHQANMIAARLNVPALPAFLDNKADKEVIVGHMRKHLLGDKPETKDLGDKETLEANDAFRARSALLDRGIRIAAIVAKYKGTWEDFRPTANAWLVAPKAFLDKGETLTGHSLTAKHVLLGSGLVAFKFKTTKGDDKSDNRTASVSALFRFNSPPPAKRTQTEQPKISEGATFNPGKVEDVARTVGLPVLIGAVHALLVTNAGKSGAAIKARDLDGPVWNMLQDIWQRMDESIASPGFGEKREGVAPPKEAIAFAKQYMGATN